jgi:hypothetical protein
VEEQAAWASTDVLEGIVDGPLGAV